MGERRTEEKRTCSPRESKKTKNRRNRQEKEGLLRKENAERMPDLLWSGAHRERSLCSWDSSGFSAFTDHLVTDLPSPAVLLLRSPFGDLCHSLLRGKNRLRRPKMLPSHDYASHFAVLPNERFWLDTTGRGGGLFLWNKNDKNKMPYRYVDSYGKRTHLFHA